MKKHLFTIFLLTILFIPAISSAAPNFLSLPFDQNYTVTSGWEYNSPCSGPGGSCRHEGIDYATGADTSILAAADGVARSYSQYDSGYGYGEYVFMYHQNSYHTLYAHLNSVNSNIPYTSSSDYGIWLSILRGEEIGKSGNTGVPSSSPHLHFESRLDNYTFPWQRVDSYDIYNTSSYYPTAGSNFAGCGSNYIWTQCPPVPPNTNPTLPVVDVTANITQNTTWQEGSVYLVHGAIVVDYGVTLTLEPGVIVKFLNSSSKINNYGYINAQGTSQDKIYFTSYKDDTAGGDSNGDGNTTTPDLEDWKSISTQLGGVTHMTNVVVKYGGKLSCSYSCSSTGALANWGGVLILNYSLLSQNRDGILMSNNGYANITGSTITESVGTGIVVSGDAINLRITDSIVSHNGGNGTSVYSSTSGAVINFAVSNSTFSQNSFYGINISINNQGLINASVTDTNFVSNQTGDANFYTCSYWGYAELNFTNYGNTTSGTGANGFYICGGQISNEQVWNPGVPFVLGYGGYRILPGATLDINPGTIVKFNGYGTGWSNAYISVNGTLDAIGTPQNKIYFTSYQDDNLGGDSNGDGNTTIPGPYDYTGVIVGNNGTANISNTVLRYGGKCQGQFTCSTRGMVSSFGTNSIVNINDSVITQNSYGIYRNDGTVNVNQSSIKNNTVYGILHSGVGTTTQATNNYWGHSSGPYHATQNPQGQGDSVSSGVTFFPWLQSSPSTSVPAP